MKTLLKELYVTLGRRETTESILAMMARSEDERLIEVAKKYGNAQKRLSYMHATFENVVTFEHQLETVAILLRQDAPTVEPLDVEGIGDQLENFRAALNGGAVQDLHARFSAAERRRHLPDMSRRRYMKILRLLKNLGEKHQRLANNLERRHFRMVSKNRLASELTPETFGQDLLSAALIAYMTALLNRRSIFTSGKQEHGLDTVAAELLHLCESSDTSNWLGIAHVLPSQNVLGRLTEEERGTLMARWHTLMIKCAAKLRLLLVEDPTIDVASMVVHRGNDSSTWNEVAGAYNKARQGWISLVVASGVQALLQHYCPGKAMRLMAADVAQWHRSKGEKSDPEVEVWSRLPFPWDVISGTKPCGTPQIEATCKEVGLNPTTSGWTGATWFADIRAFTPTKELVHGVEVSSPELATWLRRAGAFSGKVFRDVGTPPKDFVVERDPEGFAVGVTAAK